MVNNHQRSEKYRESLAHEILDRTQLFWTRAGASLNFCPQRDPSFLAQARFLQAGYRPPLNHTGSVLSLQRFSTEPVSARRLRFTLWYDDTNSCLFLRPYESRFAMPSLNGVTLRAL